MMSSAEVANELGSNPVVAVVIVTRDGSTLRWNFDEVTQSLAMRALGRFFNTFGAKPRFSLPEEEER